MKHITWQPPASVEKRHGIDLVGFDALGNRYEVESETSRGASWHTVYLRPRSGSFGGGVREAIGTRGTLGLVKALAEQTAAEIASPAVYRDAPRGPERSVGPRKGTRRNPSWWTAGQSWLEKKAQAEAMAQLKAHLKAGRARSTFRYHPPEWHRRAIELLGANDEAGFKHLKLTEGMYDHAAKRNPARVSATTLTARQINDLSRAAAQAGDLEMCAICARALQGSSAAKRAVAKAINAGQAHQNPLWPFSKPKPKPRDTMPGIWQHYPDLSGGKGKSKKNPSPRLYKVAMSNFTVRTVPEGPGEILESTGRNYRLRTSSRRKPSASPYLPAGRWRVVHGSPGASEIIVKRSQ